MNQDYLTGTLTVIFEMDTVVLAHRINGRVSYMDLGEGDHIEVKDGEGYKLITVYDVLDTIVSKRSKQHSNFHFGQSFYEGAKVRVKLNPNTTEKIKAENIKHFISNLFLSVEKGEITHEEAMIILTRNGN